MSIKILGERLNFDLSNNMSFINAVPNFGIDTSDCNVINTTQSISILGSRGPIWGVGIKSTVSNATTKNINIDPADNIYIAGEYSGNASFYASNSSSTITSLTVPTTSNSSVGVFAAKYNTLGAPLWSVAIDGPGNDQQTEITADAASNLYVAVGFSNKAPLIYNSNAINCLGSTATAASVTSALAIVNSNVSMGCCVKYNSNGQAQWATYCIGGTPTALTTDANGNVFVSTIYSTSNPVIYNSTPCNWIGDVVTFLGTGVGAYTEGTGTGAAFNSPRGMVFDTSSNMYMCDSVNQVIRKITPAGVSSLFAGKPNTGTFVDGTGSSAGFSNPEWIAIDGSNNLYVADSGNHRIRKITSAGVVSTLAGSGVSGSVDNTTGTAATFNVPSGVAVDPSYNVWVSEFGGCKIRKIAQPSTTVTTVAGSGTNGYADGTGASASFRSPRSIVLDKLGNLYVADNFSHTIRKVTSAGVVTTIAGCSNTSGYYDGVGSNALFSYPVGLSIDKYNNLYIADNGNAAIRRININNNQVCTIAGTPGNSDGLGTLAKFNGIWGIGIDNNDYLYVADISTNFIKKVNVYGLPSPAGQVYPSFSNTTTTFVSSGLLNPFGITADNKNNLYVADSRSNVIKRVNTAGTVTIIAGSGTATFLDNSNVTAGFNNPTGVTIDMSGNIYIADNSNHRIRKIACPANNAPVSGANYSVTTVAGSGTGGSNNATGTSASFSNPYDVAVDSIGNIYVSDRRNFLVRKITTAGVVSTFAGSGTSGTTNGTGSAASFKDPTLMTIDQSGNLYVSDSNLVRKITPSAVVSTALGTGTITLSNVGGLAVDILNNLYVTDAAANKVYAVTQAGNASIVAGSGAGGSNNAIGTLATFKYPTGMTIDQNGNLYISDTSNAIIRAVGPTTTLSPRIPYNSNSQLSCITCYNSSGIAQYTVNLPDEPGNKCTITTTCLTTDNLNNCYIVGTYTSNCTIVATTTATAATFTLSNSSTYFAYPTIGYIGMIWNGGNIAWGFSIWTIDNLSSVAIDNNSNLYVVGNFTSPNFAKFNYNTQLVAPPNLRASTGFLTQYSTSNGSCIPLWVAYVDGPGTITASAVKVTSNFGVHAMYNVSQPNNVIFYNADASVANFTLSSTNTGQCGVTVIYDSTGMVRDVIQTSATGNDVGIDSAGNVYMVGSYSTPGPTFYRNRTSNLQVINLPTTNSNAGYIAQYAMTTNSNYIMSSTSTSGLIKTIFNNSSTQTSIQFSSNLATKAASNLSLASNSSAILTYLTNSWYQLY